MTNNFRTVALALRDYVSGTYDILAAADSVLAALELSDEPAEFVAPADKHDHESLVRVALGSAVITVALARNQKIAAIKELRALTSAGLRDSKEAVEDSRVADRSLLVALREALAEEYRKGAEARYERGYEV